MSGADPPMVRAVAAYFYSRGAIAIKLDLLFFDLSSMP
jgi:hypothetical protein